MNNYILAGAERQRDLDASTAAFLAAGGKVKELPSRQVLPPPRKTWVDPETVLQRKRRRPSPSDRVALRRMADAL